MAVIRANGLRHFYRREGNRRLPTLVLAHPIGFDHGLWDAVMPALTQQFHVMRYDLRGHGASEATCEPCSVRLLADDAIALLRSLEIERFCFAGTSLGALVGFGIAPTMVTLISKALGGESQLRFGLVATTLVTSIAGAVGFLAAARASKKAQVPATVVASVA